MARVIGVDSLGFLPVESCGKLAENSSSGFCKGCFTGKYPADPPKSTRRNKFEQQISHGKENGAT
jgi:amidophosphoribosyltransferase